MDFAKKQMEKYGWKEGQGLGKDEIGITEALKPKLKNNNNGLGFDISEEFTNNWWDSLYKRASDNIAITETSGIVELHRIGTDSVEISNSEYKISKKDKRGVEQSFVKTSKIVRGSTIDFGIVSDKSKMKIPSLSDEELVKACGGRTAHKGARHGFNLSGKLARIEKQEKILLKQMRRISLNEESDHKIEKKCKKIEKLRINDKLDRKDDEKLSKKKKKKKRKSVSFSNAISEVIPEAEADSSFTSDDRLGYDSSSAGDAPRPLSSSRSRSSSPISPLSSSPKPKPFSRSPSPYPNRLFNIPTNNENNNNCSGTGNLPDEGIEQDLPPPCMSINNLSVITLKECADESRVSEDNDHKSFEERSDGFRANLEGLGLFLGGGDALLSKAEKKLKLRKMRASERFIVETFQREPIPSKFVARESNDIKPFQHVHIPLKRKKGKLDDVDDVDSDAKRGSCKGCIKKSRKERKQEQVVNRIAKGLEKVCKINDAADDESDPKKKA